MEENGGRNLSELKKGHEIIVQYRIFPKNIVLLLGCVLRVAGGGGWGVVRRRGREGVQEISVLI